MMNKKEIYKEAMNDIKASEELKNKAKYSKKTNSKPIFKFCAALCVFVMVFTIASFQEKPAPVLDKPQVEPEEKLAMKLPTLEGIEKYKEIATEIAKNNENNYRFTNKGFLSIDTMESVSVDSVTTNGAVSDTSASKEFSTTNVQVEGVDEADSVKTDGKYIYLIKKAGYEEPAQIVIFDVNTNEVITKISISEKLGDYHLDDLFLYNNKLVVLGGNYGYATVRTKIQEDNDTTEKNMAIADVAYVNNTSMFAIVYDVSDKNNIKEERIVELEGNYISARMIDGNVYIISNKHNYHYQTKEIDNLKETDVAPIYRDTAQSEEYQYKKLDSIYYLPETEELSMLNVASFNVNNKEEAKIESFLGAGQTVYANTENLYITRTKYEYENKNIIADVLGGSYKTTVKTAIYKLALNNGDIEFKTSTEVDGYMNSQFSMDEYEGNLRVAVTTYRGEDNETVNNLYILNENLETIGTIDNMAVGEKIYSVRFLGNKGYVVTFKQIDPLFVIDLSVPENPQILGELKIPGYSSYLHPYDENHVIGIGYNTEETSYGATTNAGMKLSLFDVSDVKNPKEISNTIIGERGTYSEATYNHKAILFSKEKNILAFPVSVAKAVGEYSTNTVFHGAMIFNIDLENGFSEAGRIPSSSKVSDYVWDEAVERIIYVGDKYYTIARNLIQVADMNSFEILTRVEVK